ncbi:hypothetical protein L7F22_066982 [Adiantum nelumboides]|nr:hypothetical protein [Adiantum nelumboides]
MTKPQFAAGHDAAAIYLVYPRAHDDDEIIVACVDAFVEAKTRADIYDARAEANGDEPIQTLYSSCSKPLAPSVITYDNLQEAVPHSQPHPFLREVQPQEASQIFCCRPEDANADEVIIDMFLATLEKRPFVCTTYQSSATLSKPLADATTLEASNEPSIRAMPIAPSSRPAYNDTKDDGDDSFDAAKISDAFHPLSIALELVGSQLPLAAPLAIFIEPHVALFSKSQLLMQSITFGAMFYVDQPLADFPESSSKVVLCGIGRHILAVKGLQFSVWYAS